MTARSLFRLAITGLLVSCLHVRASDPGVVFRATPAPESPAALDGPNSNTVLEAQPADGQFVYSLVPVQSARRLRFPIGSVPQTDFSLFSAQEIEQLELLRAKLSPPKAELKAAEVVGHTHRSSPRHAHFAKVCSPLATSAAASPKVVRDGTKVCVPSLGFADASDWQSHLICYDEESGNVR